MKKCVKCGMKGKGNKCPKCGMLMKAMGLSEALGKDVPEYAHGTDPKFRRHGLSRAMQARTRGSEKGAGRPGWPPAKMPYGVPGMTMAEAKKEEKKNEVM